MSLDIAEFGAFLDELSLGLVMVDPEDLLALGEVLGKVETLMKASEEIGPPEGTMLLKGINKALEAIVLDHVSDKAQVMEVVGQGGGPVAGVVAQLFGRERLERGYVRISDRSSGSCQNRA